ncbi:CU044_5270 family protein [Thermomonospora umbrina]|uniref:CU044_5270 family protein n=1 Tax=Thermomonospora umbrina TaxID=111806 RepID=A0A3D9T6S1_9ACTN|nr:CU044_5270 family protein [Thermomonospora umbrina]REF00385.1 hypothetical protein DFJ69_5919 [Thermomonospora umbrina]
MTHDEIDVFRKARPDVPPFDPDAKSRTRASLLDAAVAEAGPVNASPRRSWRRAKASLRIGAVVAATATVLAGVAVLRNAGESGGIAAPPTVRISSPAAENDRPRPDQWSYIKGLSVGSSGGVGGFLFGKPDKRIPFERWVSVDGKRTASYQKGRLVVQGTGSVAGMSPPSGYPFLLALPTDPTALLARLDQVIDREGGEAPNAEARASRAFTIMEIWLREVALPSDLRRGMYEALRRIPGVKFEGRAADVAGRPGVTFYRIEEGYLRSEILMNPTTHEYMGYRSIAIRDHVSRGTDSTRSIKKGHVMGWGAVTRAAIVDEQGRRP